jgi:hypothetical protein
MLDQRRMGGVLTPSQRKSDVLKVPAAKHVEMLGDAAESVRVEKLSETEI